MFSCHRKYFADTDFCPRTQTQPRSEMLCTLEFGPISQLPRVKSLVFEAALPENNLFDQPCKDAKLGNSPAGIFSPSIDYGFYVKIAPLKKGNHTLHILATNPSQKFSLDVTYKLNVVPVLRK